MKSKILPRPRLKGIISYSLRCQNLAKEALIKQLYASTETERHNVAVGLLGKLIELSELVGTKGTAEDERQCFTECDRAWQFFASKCGAVIDGMAPTGLWFRQAVVQIAYNDADYDEMQLADNLKNLGWKGSILDYIEPTPKDGQDLHILPVDIVKEVA